MLKSNAIKKILPGLLIVIILVTGIFGAFGIKTAHADTGCVPGLVDVKKAVVNVVDVGKGYRKLVNWLWPKNSVAGPQNVDVVESGFDVARCVHSVIAIAMTAILGVFSLFVYLGAYVLNASIDYTVVGMGANIKEIGVIEEGWRTFRDLADIVLIFVLLVVGIQTILGAGSYGTKKLVIQLILIAIFINFSLFFTQLIVDASNILAYQFYLPEIGTKIVEALKISSIFDIKKIVDVAAADKTNLNLILITSLGVVLYLITTFVLFAGAFLFIIRFVVLIILMVVAPLAFVGMILPATARYAKDWWSKLISYSLFAPLFLIMLWFISNVMTSPGFKRSLKLTGNESFSNIVVEKGAVVMGQSNVTIFLSFVIIIFFLLVALILSVKLGIMGSGSVMKMGKNLSRWGVGFVGGVAGRNTVGVGSRYARAWYDDRQAKAESTAGGRAARRAVSIVSLGALSDRSVKGALKAGETAKFGSKESYKDRSDAFRARRGEVKGIQKDIEVEKVFDKASKGGSLTDAESALIGEMKIKQLEKAGIKEHLTNKNVAQHLSGEQLESITKSDQFTQQEIDGIRDARFEDIVTGVKAGNKKSISDLKKLSDKEIEMLGNDSLRNDEVIRAMSQSQISVIKKSNKLNSSLKKYVSDQKTNLLVKLTDPELETVVKTMKPTEISKLDSTILTKEVATKAYSPAVLIEIAKEASVADRNAIRAHIKKAVSNGTATPEQIASEDWFSNPSTPAGVIF